MAGRICKIHSDQMHVHYTFPIKSCKIHRLSTWPMIWQTERMVMEDPSVTVAASSHDRSGNSVFDHWDMENDPIPQSGTGPPCSLLVLSGTEASVLLLQMDRPAKKLRRIL